MSTPSAGQRSGCLPKLFWGAFGLVLVGAMALLFFVLGGESDSGRVAIEAYVATIRAGADVSAEIGGPEAIGLTQILRTTDAVEVDNFQAQANTACFWVTLSRAGSESEARFVLVSSGEGYAVRSASMARECECPDPDFEAPCHLR